MPNLTKICVLCKVEKNITEFYPNGYTKQDGSKSTRNDCADCCKQRRAEYFKTPVKRAQINARRRSDYKTDGGQRKSKNRKYALKNNYGLSVEQVDEMLKAQNYCCKICGLHESEIPKCRLFVDHKHNTKEIRGLLCQNCNSALGHAKDNAETLLAMVEYLDKVKK
jgi:hypothetical protein